MRGKAMRRLLCISSVMLTIPFAANAAEVCVSVSGSVRMTPDPECKVVSAYAGQEGVTFLGLPYCFSVSARGTLKGSGSSGLSSGFVVGADGSQTGTPLGLVEPGVPPVTDNGLTRQIMSGRSVVSLARGKLFFSDLIVSGKNATLEQLIVTGGTGKYAGASGNITINGNAITGAEIPYYGTICTK